MNLQVTVAHKGEEVGTVGWLAANLRGVRISVTKSGKRGVWLDVGDKSACIVMRDPYDIARDYPEQNTYQIMPRTGDVDLPGLPWAVTDACWRSIEDIGKQCIAILTAEDGKEEELRVKVTIATDLE